MAEEPDYSAMTVNERLFVSNRTKEFDQAILLRNRAGAVQILADLDVSSPEETVDAIFGYPGKYGFY